jgi:hypothetical protein
MTGRALVALCLVSLCPLCETSLYGGERGVARQHSECAASAGTSNADATGRLVGEWVAPEERIERSTALDVSVFGPHAFDVKNVMLTIRPSGEGVLRVSHVVVGRGGRKYVPSIIEATLRIAAPPAETAHRIQPAVTVVHAERKYMDGTGDQWVLEGSRVTVMMIDPPGGELNVRLDTSDGRDSFGTTLKRRGHVPHSHPDKETSCR